MVVNGYECNSTGDERKAHQRGSFPNHPSLRKETLGTRLFFRFRAFLRTPNFRMRVSQKIHPATGHFNMFSSELVFSLFLSNQPLGDMNYCSYFRTYQAVPTVPRYILQICNFHS